MTKNIKYELGKRLLEEYISKTEKEIAWLKEMCNRYDNTEFDLPEFGGFDYHKSLKVIRSWKILNELPADKKNLFIIFCACDYDYTKTLEIFNDIGKGCKNVSTLRVLVSNVRKIIKEKYDKQYGTD